MIINIHSAGSPRKRPSEIHDEMISKGNIITFVGLKEVKERTKPPINQKVMTEPPQPITKVRSRQGTLKND